MSAETALFNYKQLQLEYLVSGNGKEVIFAFHGFGQDESGFDDLLPLIEEHQKLVRIRLFQHGRSIFPENRIPNSPLDKKEWKSMMDAFADYLGAGSYCLLGYSLGARICLNLLETDNNRIRSILLLAPDGFKVNLLYQFSSNTALGRSIYRFVMHKPGVLFKTADILHSTGILNVKLHRFVHFHMRNFEQRKLVYDTWVIYRKMHPNLKKIRQKLLNDELDLSAVFGRYDAIIRPSLGRKFFSEKLKGSMHIVDSGHLLISPDTADYIRKEKLWF